MRVEHADLALDVHEDAAHALFDRQGLEQRLPLARLDVEVAGHEVGEPARVGDPFQHLLHDFLRESRFLTELGRALASLAVQGHVRGIVDLEGRQLFGLADDRLQVAAPFQVLQRRAPGLPLEQQLHAAQTPLDLSDPRDGAHGIQPGGRHLVHVLALRNGEDKAGFALDGRFNGAEGCRPPRADRLRDAGEQHDLPEREHRERLTFEHCRTPIRSHDELHCAASSMPLGNTRSPAHVPRRSRHSGRDCRKSHQPRAVSRQNGRGTDPGRCTSALAPLNLWPT